jgi:hypothetical protein
VAITAKVGDLFSVPLNSEFWGVGIVSGRWKSELYLILFKEKFDSIDKLRNVDIESLTPLFSSSSLDAKIWHGHWPVVRVGVDTSRFVQPIYKIEEPIGFVAESFDRTIRRAIDPTLAEHFALRKGVAPVRLENALKAFHGLVPWDSVFDELKYDLAVTSNRFIGME